MMVSVKATDRAGLMVGLDTTSHNVILQSKHQLVTAGMVHVTNLTPGGDMTTLRDGPDHRRAAEAQRQGVGVVQLLNPLDP
jgi:hypothetical protein